MSVIGEFTVPASALAMRQTLAATPDITVDIERVVAHQRGILTPYFWIRGGDRARFEDAIESDPTVADCAQLDDLEDGALYRATWPTDVQSLGEAYLETGVTILEATGRDDEWEMRLRFDSHQDVSTFYEHCEDNDIQYAVNRIYNPTEPKAGGQFGVTPKQHEALLAALESGYYELPPEANMEEVTTTVGISQQALSKRLRRAHGNLVSHVLTVEELDAQS